MWAGNLRHTAVGSERERDSSDVQIHLTDSFRFASFFVFPRVMMATITDNEVVEICVGNFVNPDLDSDVHAEAFEKIKDAILATNAKITLQDLIGAMGSQLTSNDDKERNRATLLLSDLFQVYPSNSLSPVEVHLFVVFFVRRLSDYPSISPSLQALVWLLRAQTLDPKYMDVVDIFQSIFKELHVQGLAQTIRQKTFELFKEIMSNELTIDAAKLIGGEVLEGLVVATDGEKDPRCLVLSLGLLTSAAQGLKEFVVEPMAERIYEAVACYFPITFQPPADDPFGITSEMLISGGPAPLRA